MDGEKRDKKIEPFFAQTVAVLSALGKLKLTCDPSQSKWISKRLTKIGSLKLGYTVRSLLFH